MLTAHPRERGRGSCCSISAHFRFLDLLKSPSLCILPRGPAVFVSTQQNGRSRGGGWERIVLCESEDFAGVDKYATVHEGLAQGFQPRLHRRRLGLRGRRSGAHDEAFDFIGPAGLNASRLEEQ